jgi:subtilisin-like proprotein convertase family protein
MKAQNIILLLIAVLIIFPGKVISQEIDGYGLNGSNQYLGGLGTTDDYVSVPHDPDLSQGADASIEAWIYITDQSTLNYIIAKGAQQGTSAYAFYINTSGKPAIRFGNLNLVSNGPSVPLNTWTHVAVTWNDPGNIDVNFYIDGNKAGTTITTPGSVLTNTHEVRIGTAEFGNEGFGGYIDEVRLWGGVLTQSQVRENRFIGLGEKPASNFDGSNFSGSINYDGLVASWTFNAGLAQWTWEYIGGHFGTRHGGAAIQDAMFGYPMPYNNALYFPGTGGDDNLVELRDSVGFTNELVNNGTIELWAYFNGGMPTQKTAFVSKGATDNTNSFYLGVGQFGRLTFRIGQATITSQGDQVPEYTWFHTAASWERSGSTYRVKLYLNGELQDSIVYSPPLMPVNSDPITLGKAPGFPDTYSPVNTFLDEIKIWNTTQSQDTIRRLMFASAPSLESMYQNSLLATWSFDGNLIPTGRFARMRGTFEVGTTNRCRFSSYLYEGSLNGNILNLHLIPHITVMKSVNPVAHTFPLGFYQIAPFDTIPFNNVNGINSVISVGPSFPDDNVSNVELFLSAAAPDLEDFQITLTAPNGNSRTVMNNNGGLSDNILTIFKDDAIMGVNSPDVVAPFTSSVRPLENFGDFNNSPARGNWTLNVKQLSTMSSAGNGPAFLNGWGIRLNGQSVTGIQNVTTELPKKYELSQNYPNPFNPSTSIKFSIPQSGVVSLKVYDILGKEVATLVNSKLNAGVFEYNFNASALSSGVYFYRLNAGSFVEIKKMLLVK